MELKIRDNWLAWSAVLGSWIISLGWIFSKVGTAGLISGVSLSALVTVIVVGALYWLGRVSPKNMQLIHAAFIWGASLAAFMSLLSQELLQIFCDTYFGTEFSAWFRPLVITPVTEEIFKGLFLIWLLINQRACISTSLNGIVFGGFVGSGFAFTEQILYFGGATVNLMHTSDSSAMMRFLMSLVIRGVMVPFMHPFFVALIGVSVSYAARIRSRFVRVACVLIGFIFPITLHGLWDWAGLVSTDQFLILKIYAYVMFPSFIIVTIFSVILRQTERKSYSLLNDKPELMTRASDDR